MIENLIFRSLQALDIAVVTNKEMERGPEQEVNFKTNNIEVQYETT